MKTLTGPHPTLWFVLVVALCTALTASAQQPGVLQSYDVELIVFRHLNSNATPEEWTMATAGANSGLEIPDEEAMGASVSAPAPTESAGGFPALAPAKFKLTAMEETLRRSRNYRPIAHIGWTQPGFPRTEARYFSVGALAPESTGLSGQIALTRGRYLHLTLDLAYEVPEEPGQRYVLRQTRRMRSSERHYIDHPKFGVIALITPSTP